MHARRLGFGLWKPDGIRGIFTSWLRYGVQSHLGCVNDLPEPLARPCVTNCIRATQNMCRTRRSCCAHAAADACVGNNIAPCANYRVNKLRVALRCQTPSAETRVLVATFLFPGATFIYGLLEIVYIFTPRRNAKKQKKLVHNIYIYI